MIKKEEVKTIGIGAVVVVIGLGVLLLESRGVIDHSDTGSASDFQCGTSVVEDPDGNSYSTLSIGDQCWFGENLQTTQYSDGSDIPLIEDHDDWWDDSEGSYALYDHNFLTEFTAEPVTTEQEMKDTFGYLYNFYAVATGKLCPEGWQVPSDDDWKELEQELGMSREEADLLYWRGNPLGIKLAGNYELWDEDSFRDREEFGETGFDAVPAGYRMSNGRYSWLNKRANIWSSTLRASGWRRTIIYSSSGIRRTAAAKNFGFSVRCIKDR